MKDSEIIDVVTARRDGKDIEYESDTYPWTDMTHGAAFNFVNCTYRVKPKKPHTAILDVYEFSEYTDHRLHGGQGPSLDGINRCRTSVRYVEYTDEVKALLGDIVDD